jgi:hypothetical protein
MELKKITTMDSVIVAVRALILCSCGLAKTNGFASIVLEQNVLCAMTAASIISMKIKTI